MEEETTENVEITTNKLGVKYRNGKIIPGQQSLNPEGRPKGSVSLLTILKQKLELIPEGDKRSYAEIFIENTLQDALDLDGPSRKMIMQYIEGLPIQKTELTHIIPKPLDDVSQNLSVSENKGNDQEDKSDSGRHLSQQDSEHPAVFDSEVSV